MKMVVTGSLGNISKPLTEKLLKDGHTVTVISSNEGRREEIEAMGATAAIGSIEDVHFITQTLTGADAFYAMVPPNYGETDVVAYYSRVANKYAAAIAASGVQRVVHLSSYGADLDSDTGFILGAHYAENILNTLSGVTVTHLRPGYFYYNLLSFAGMAKHAGFISANYGGDDKMVFVAPADIALAAADALSTTGNAQPVQYIVSDEMTADEAAGILGAAIGKPGMQWRRFSDEQTAEAMQQRGMPEHMVNNFVTLGAAIHNGRLLQDYAMHEKDTYRGTIKLEHFAKNDFATAYQKA